MTDEQAYEDSEDRMDDRGDDWWMCDDLFASSCPLESETLRQALHDRDRYHREAAYWREECINLTAEMLR